MLRDTISTGQRSIGLARHLRKRQTPGERALWRHLRARRFRGLKFRRQAPLGPYIVDFLCVEKRLIIEIDGVSHTYLSTQTRDAKRSAYLRSHGFAVLRFGNHQAVTAPDVILSRIAVFLGFATD